MKEQFDAINPELSASVSAAIDAYDKLVEAVKADEPEPKQVLHWSGVMWTSSLKAWARLILIPGQIANEIVKEK